MRFPGRNLHQGGSSQIKVRSFSRRTATCPRAQRNSSIPLFQSPELHHFCTKNCTTHLRLGNLHQGRSNQIKVRSLFRRWWRLISSQLFSQILTNSHSHGVFSHEFSQNLTSSH